MEDHRRPRETSRLSLEGWSDWVKAMVPPNVKGNNTKRRGAGQVGSICTDIESAFPDEAEECGIYEWKAKGTLANQPIHVVYVGSTCRGKTGALRRRINEYCRNGSHKANLINGALNRGYELWVRVKTSKKKRKKKRKKKEDAENMENELLEKYNYAWNVRNNAIRNILP